MKHAFALFAFALMSSASAQVSDHVPEDGLRYWSDFDGSVVDQSVHQTSTSLFGAVPTADRNGTAEGAMFFDGVDDHVKLFEGEGGVTFEDELTVAAWMKAEEFLGGQHPRLFHSSEGVGGGFDRWFFTWSPASAGSVVGFGVGNGQNSTVGVDSQSSVTPGGWHHVAAIFQNGLVKVLVDGMLESEAPLSFTSLNHIDAPVFLGSALGNSHFNGALDEVGIWDRALSVEEIFDLYSMSSGITELPDYVPTEGLVAWWGLNGDGTDASDFENHGTVYGAVGSEDRWGVANSSMSFENYGDRIEFGEISTSIGLPNQALTISSWFKGAAIQNGSNSGQIVAVNYGTTSRQVRLEVVHDFAEAPEAPGNRLKYYWRCPEENDEPESPEEYSPLIWNHYVLTVDPEFGEVRIYLNGIQVNEMTSTYAPTNDYSGGVSRSWMIGALYPSPNFESPQFYGNIDDVGIWNMVLTEAEILTLYNAEQELFGCTDPEACNFNEAANEDDGSCEYSCCPGPGCCDVGMHWDWELGMCQITNVADTNLDGCVQLNDLLDVLSAYGNCGTEELQWQCGDPLEYQSYNYETVQIGEQCWFADNLRNEQFRNGDIIPTDLNNSSWFSINAPAMTIYGLGSSQCDSHSPLISACNPDSSLAEYGRLYNWYAVVDERGLCPSGWHEPSDEEWMELELQLGINADEVWLVGTRGNDQGFRLKTNSNWYGGNNGDNSLSFSAKPSGYRHGDGMYLNEGKWGGWWTSSSNGQYSWYRHVSSNFEGIHRGVAGKMDGFPVRCLQDSQ